MTAATADVRNGVPSGQPTPDGPWATTSNLLVRAVPALQAVLTAAGALALVAAILIGPQGLPLPLFVVALAVPLLYTIAAGASTILTLRQESRGRVLAVIVDYLGFLTAFLLLHFSGVFTGFDDLADVFGATLPWIVVALIGFVLGYVGDSANRTGPVARAIRYARLGLYAVAGIGFLWAIDAVRGAIDLVVGTLTDPLRLALLIISLIVFGFLAALWGRAGRTRFGATLAESDILDGVLFISPNLLGFLGFFAGPLLFSLYVSLTDWDAFSDPFFLGFQNYIDILALQFVVLEDTTVIVAPGLDAGFTEIFRFGPLVIAAQDNLFWISLRNIILFSIIAIPMAVIPALFLATLLNERVRGIRVFRAIYFIPSVAGIVGIAIIWRQLLDQTVGWINYGITLVVDALNGSFGLAIVDPKIGWLSDPATALPVIAVVFAWTTVGFNAILFLAGLQGIPADLYEAATIDGANRWQRFRSITLPAVSATTFFVVATTTILALQLFTEPFVLKGLDPGGPNNATLTPVMYLYRSGFQSFEFGYASAVAWILFAFIFVFTIVQYRRQRDEAFGG